MKIRNFQSFQLSKNEEKTKSWNKKGAEKILSIYWFAVLIIVALGIFGMVFVFYGYPYDFREVETTTLTNKIADCVAEGGQVKANLSDFDLIRDCSLNFEDSTYDILQYYIQIEFLDLNGDLLNEFSAGNNNFLSSCEIQDDDYKKLVKCNEKKFYSTLEGRGVLIKILSAVRKTEKNTK